MDKTVPAPAAHLLDLIRKTETSRDGIAAYRTIFAHKEGNLPKPITEMRLDEVLNSMDDWGRKWGSSATGGYQFIRSTLMGLAKELKLRAQQIFDPDLQDRLGHHLLVRRGYDKWIKGEISDTAFGNNLAKEWASFPVLSAINGKRRGQSYYQGDAVGNKALISPATVEGALKTAKKLATLKPDDDVVIRKEIVELRTILESVSVRLKALEAKL